MKIKEVAKVSIELTKEENKTLYDAQDIINKIADSLDSFGLYTDEYEKLVDGINERFAKLFDALEEGFEREIEEKN
jgi:hypothetical protein